jgi:hypothetical protein
VFDEAAGERVLAGLWSRCANTRSGYHLECSTAFGNIAEKVACVAAVHDGEDVGLYFLDQGPLSFVPDCSKVVFRIISPGIAVS